MLLNRMYSEISNYVGIVDLSELVEIRYINKLIIIVVVPLIKSCFYFAKLYVF